MRLASERTNGTAGSVWPFRWLMSWGIVLLILSVFSTPGFMTQMTSPSSGRIIVRGHVEEKPGASAPHQFIFRTTEGRVYGFRSGDRAVALFRDERIRRRELEILAVQHPAGELELIRVFWLRDGRKFELSYVCETCSITEPVPGRCPCCGAPLELREVAVPDR
ncbi:MAG TPA: hypothetical protein VNM72_01870 [Blastocatellia bacterium]|nr:hypothetical protein [Blastocatellia bacterium]